MPDKNDIIKKLVSSNLPYTITNFNVQSLSDDMVSFSVVGPAVREAIRQPEWRDLQKEDMQKGEEIIFTLNEKGVIISHNLTELYDKHDGIRIIHSSKTGSFSIQILD
jgi:hypothetical protein